MVTVIGLIKGTKNFTKQRFNKILGGMIDY